MIDVGIVYSREIALQKSKIRFLQIYQLFSIFNNDVYVHKDEGIGHQRVSQRKTSPAVGFGKAKRNINLRSLTSSSDRPENIPGPVDYNTLRSSVKLMRRRPSTDFGTSSRFEY